MNVLIDSKNHNLKIGSNRYDGCETMVAIVKGTRKKIQL